MNEFFESIKQLNDIKPVVVFNDEYEIIDPLRNSSSSIMSDQMVNPIPTTLWGVFKQEISKMTNVIKFNIISNENKLDDTSLFPIQILHHKFNPQKKEEKAKLSKLLSQEFIWFSYRSNIEKMIYNNQLYQSDAGWGCMIRVGQMILAKGIIQIFNLKFDTFYSSGLYLFLDFPISMDYLHDAISFLNYQSDKRPSKNHKSSKRAPYFSIQEICQTSPSNNKGPGDWFSNYDIISIFQIITMKHNPLHDVQILNFSEGTVYIKNIIEECFEIATCNCIALSFEEIIPVQATPVKVHGFEIIEKSRCVKNVCECKKNIFNFNNEDYRLKKKFLMFISVRHGLYEIEEEYKESVFQFFNIKNNLGIIGGKNQRALYFIGYSQNNLICLDPHFVQDTCNLPSIQSGKSKESYQPKYYSIDINQLSPSFTMGLYCNTIEDFRTLITQLTEHGKLENKLFSIREHNNQNNNYYI